LFKFLNLKGDEKMGGLFGVVSRGDCVNDVYFGTDYHSHLGTSRGGIAMNDSKGFSRVIHNISSTPFRTKFEGELPRLKGNLGIGVISDHESQPLVVKSHLGTYAIATVGKVSNLEGIVSGFLKSSSHFLEMGRGGVNPTEVVAATINQGRTFEEGIKLVQENLEGSCSLLLLTDEGIYAARDKLGRTPIVIGEKEGSFAATSETSALPNRHFKIRRDLDPGEIVLMSRDGIDQKKAPGEEMKLCSFLYVYYSFPATVIEGIDVDGVRHRCGQMLARRDVAEQLQLNFDYVAGIPDSGTGHAIGYSNELQRPFRTPCYKYTVTWGRSFMPQDQSRRDEVADMKLILNASLIEGRKILFCEDSIVRGTQLRRIIQKIYECGAEEIHMRSACPPLTRACPYLNFSISKSELDLAARRAIRELEGETRVSEEVLDEYSTAGTDKNEAMVRMIGDELGLNSLRYQRLCDLVGAIGLPKEKLCTYCWDGKG